MKDKFYYKDGAILEGDYRDSSKILHREDGPAVEKADGTKRWYLNGLLHREGGPAIEWTDGDVWWYLNGQRHRKGGPAAEEYRCRRWYLNDQLHREDGPAVEYTAGGRGWFLNNQEYTEQEYFNFLKEIDALEPMIGLTDSREWVRKRWKNKLKDL